MDPGNLAASLPLPPACSPTNRQVLPPSFNLELQLQPFGHHFTPGEHRVSPDFCAWFPCLGSRPSPPCLLHLAARLSFQCLPLPKDIDETSGNAFTLGPSAPASFFSWHFLTHCLLPSLYTSHALGRLPKPGAPLLHPWGTLSSLQGKRVSHSIFF